jgi:sugar porter (SP) family MFS transporter
VYISEVSPAGSRGRLVSLNQLAIVIGILAAYCVNWRLSMLGESSWRWMFAVGIVPSLALLAGLFFIPESPRWLITHGKTNEGRAVLGQIAGSDAELQLQQIIEAGLEDRTISLRDLIAPALRNRLFVAVMLAVLQQISGINTVLYYGSVMFTEHFSNASAQHAIGANVIVGAVNLACTIVAMLLIDGVGRRVLLMASSGGMTVCLAVLVLSFKLPVFVPALAFSAILLYVACFAVGLGPAVWVYMAEIFPTNVRGRAMSVATGALWAACIAVTLTFLSIMHAVGIHGAFALYAVLSFFTLLFVWKWVPETRGRSLEQIQRMWDE